MVVRRVLGTEERTGAFKLGVTVEGGLLLLGWEGLGRGVEEALAMLCDMLLTWG